MRNRYPGTCYRCGDLVAPGDGHFERLGGRWRTQHADCAIKWRGTPDPEREAWRIRKLQIRARRTGNDATRARKELRALGVNWD